MNRNTIEAPCDCNDNICSGKEDIVIPNVHRILFAYIGILRS
jgi:hypothetical protein